MGGMGGGAWVRDAPVRQAGDVCDHVRRAAGGIAQASRGHGCMWGRFVARWLCGHWNTVTFSASQFPPRPSECTAGLRGRPSYQRRAVCARVNMPWDSCHSRHHNEQLRTPERVLCLRAVVGPGPAARSAWDSRGSDQIMTGRADTAVCGDARHRMRARAPFLQLEKFCVRKVRESGNAERKFPVSPAVFPGHSAASAGHAAPSRGRGRARAAHGHRRSLTSH